MRLTEDDRNIGLGLEKVLAKSNTILLDNRHTASDLDREFEGWKKQNAAS